MSTVKRPTRVKANKPVEAKVETQEGKYDPKAGIRELIQVDLELAALKKKKADLEKPLKAYVTEHGSVETYSVINKVRVPYKAQFVTTANNSIDKDALVAEVGLQGAWDLAKVTQTDVNKVHGQVTVDKVLIKGEKKSFSCKQVK